jgi:hypothetical protein
VSVMASETGQILANAAPAADVIERDVVVIIQSVSESIESIAEIGWNEAIKNTDSSWNEAATELLL